VCVCLCLCVCVGIGIDEEVCVGVWVSVGIHVSVDVCLHWLICANNCYGSTHGTFTCVCADVNINLKIVKSPVKSISDQDWVRLGLSEHICEIQLMPLSYAQEKTEVAHQNYIKWRNLSSQWIHVCNKHEWLMLRGFPFHYLAAVEARPQEGSKAFVDQGSSWWLQYAHVDDVPHSIIYLIPSCTSFKHVCIPHSIESGRNWGV